MLEQNFNVRGFAGISFIDTHGKECSIQKSSIATYDGIWLGISQPNPILLVPGMGWEPYVIPKEVQINTRMHLNQEMAKELIEVLTKFVESGEIV